MAINGLVVMTPTSIAVTGTSASINANGSVVFSGMTNLELRGVFTTNYDNYMIVYRENRTTDNGPVAFRLMSGTTPASGANYTYQYISVYGTSVSGSRESSQTSMRFGWGQNNKYNAATAFIFGPYLAQPTAMRGVAEWSVNDAGIEDYASTHSLSTSYDGCVIFPSTGVVTGLLTVFGFNQ